MDVLQFSLPAAWRPIYTSHIKCVFCWQTATWRARRLHLTQMASTCWPVRIAPVHENSAGYLWRGKMDLVLRGTELPCLHFLVSYTCVKKEGRFQTFGRQTKKKRKWNDPVLYQLITELLGFRAVELDDIVFTALPTWHKSLGQLWISKASWNKTLTSGQHC